LRGWKIFIGTKKSDIFIAFFANLNSRYFFPGTENFMSFHGKIGTYVITGDKSRKPFQLRNARNHHLNR